jgi:hypothetical protein
MRKEQNTKKNQRKAFASKEKGTKHEQNQKKH